METPLLSAEYISRDRACSAAHAENCPKLGPQIGIAAQWIGTITMWYLPCLISPKPCGHHSWGGIILSRFQNEARCSSCFASVFCKPGLASPYSLVIKHGYGKSTVLIGFNCSISYTWLNDHVQYLCNNLTEDISWIFTINYITIHRYWSSSVTINHH